MDKRLNYLNSHNDASDRVATELAGLGLSVDTLYDGVSDDCPCCKAARQETLLAA